MIRDFNSVTYAEKTLNGLSSKWFSRSWLHYTQQLSTYSCVLAGNEAHACCMRVTWRMHKIINITTPQNIFFQWFSAVLQSSPIIHPWVYLVLARTWTPLQRIWSCQGQTSTLPYCLWAENNQHCLTPKPSPFLTTHPCSCREHILTGINQTTELVQTVLPLLQG